MSKLNLDQQCARFGHDMCQAVSGVYQGKEKKTKTENLITKSLGVLQEDGVYAFFLYLAAQAKSIDEKNGKKPKRGQGERDGKGGKDEKAAAALASKATDLLCDEQVTLLQLPTPNRKIRETLEAICAEDGLADRLDDLLLAKRLLEQALTYARYHAKALGN
jgi:hypothetical protein